MGRKPILKPLHRQVAVVAGASSGIGRETALRFARGGARAVVSARGEAGLQTLVEEIRSAGNEARAAWSRARWRGCGTPGGARSLAKLTARDRGWPGAPSAFVQHCSSTRGDDMNTDSG
ncbi:MAG: SDR family NAD(P)-dependent oxidoreductase [Gemmatimonadetes bacterium]|nr:SDR family NAD(P)-dependent oxidoreductase [Gemmatimonadota bacterium]